MVLRLVLLLGLSGLIFAGFYVWLAQNRWALFDTATGAFLLLAAQVFCVEMLLLAVGWLGLWQVVALHLLLSAAIWAWTGRAIPGNVRWAWRELRRSCSEMTWYSWLALAIMAVLVILVSTTAFYLPDLGWDANMYHIPIAASRLQEGDLQRLDSSWPWIEGYPQTGEMFILWNLLFTGTQVLADAAQLPFWLFGALAIISLSVKMGAKLPYAIAGSLVWMFAPIAILQAQNAGNDLIVASLFWMGLSFAFHRPASPLSVSLAGITAVLMVGTKLGSLWLVVVLGLFTVLAALQSPNKRAVIVAFLVVWIGCGFLNAHWYLSNWKLTGNPVWPLGISAGPVVLSGDPSMEGYEPRYTPPELAGRPIWQQSWLVWLEPDSVYSEAAMLTGFGPLWLVLGLPAIATWALLERKGWQLVAALLLVLLLQPVAWHTRYVLFLPGLGAIALAVVLSRLGTYPRVLTGLLILVCVVFSFLVTLRAHSIQYLWMPSSYRTQVYSSWSLSGGAYRWLDTNAQAPAEVIYGGRVAFPAPLWGEDLRHSVTYVWPLDTESWQHTVLDRGTKWVFAVIGSEEDQILEGSTQFELVVDDRRIDYPPTLPSRIYQSIREGALND